MRASKQRRVPSALLRPALWICTCNLLAGSLAAQCANPTQVPNGTYTSGDHSQVDNNALSASSFSVSQGATATFAAGSCIHLGPGFRANAVGATVPTTFHAWVDTAPTAVSVVPSSPPQNPPLTQSFTWTVSSPAGQSNLSHVFALFNTTSSSTANACYIHYDASTNLVYLADNASTTWLGGFAPSSSGSIGNSQCTIAGTNSSPNPTTSSAQLGLTLNVTFNAVSFSGTKNEYLYALDGSGASTGWQQMGTWTVPAPPAPDFTLTAVTDLYYVQTGVMSYPSYSLTITPQNGFNSPASFSMSWPMYGCGYPTFSPAIVMGPPWTTTVSMQCYETLPNTYWTQLTAWGGGKSHSLNLYLQVAQNPYSFLTTSVSLVGGGYISPGSGWYSTGSYVTITATPASGHQFSAFSGVDSSNGSTGYVTMNGNRYVTAIFTQAAVTQTITSVPSGRSLTVDGAACTAPCVRQWQAGSNHTISAANQSGGTGTQYSFSSWSDGGASTHTITAPSSSATYTATFATQYLLTTSAATGGSISPAPPGAWCNAGAQVQVSATANSGYQFSGFSGALTGTTTPQWVTLSGPSAVSANFTSLTAPDFTITVSPPQSMPSGQLVTAIPVTITPLNGFSSPVNFTWTNTATWPTDLTASFTQNPAIGATNVSIGSSERTPSGHYSLQFSAAAAGNTHNAELEIPVPDIEIWYSYGLVALDTGDVYAYFATWVTGADAAGARSQVQAARLSLNGSQILPTTNAAIAYGSDPSFLPTNPFVLSNVGFGTYGFDFYYAQDWCCWVTQDGTRWPWFQSLRQVDSVTYPAPSISSLAPSYASPGATLDLTINGSGLGIADADVNLYRGITSVNIYGSGCPSTCGITATVRPVSVGDVPSGGPPPAASSTQASITVSATAQSGTYQISVTAFGVESNRVNFVVGDSTPVINYITQQTLQSGQQGSVSIYGSNFGTGCSNVACTGASISVCRSSDSSCGSSDVVPVSVTYWSDTQIDATLSAGPSASGSYDVQVTSAGAAGLGFSPTPAQTTSSQSNRKSIAVNSNPNVSLRVTSNGSTLSASTARISRLTQQCPRSLLPS